jgi:hypothetical protein
MVFLARICKKNMLAPEKKGPVSELFLVLSTPVYIYYLKLSQIQYTMKFSWVISQVNVEFVSDV